MFLVALLLMLEANSCAVLLTPLLYLLCLKLLCLLTKPYHILQNIAPAYLPRPRSFPR